ncbi:MAG: PaaI family thioesterase [Archangium sp.]|nr:PaaI family thioesterase [Archangium sp.]MDP3155934.1 PaaI family thioesterase [Archangium sp.]MDP3576170.1 PaaI family thioesterase [Archangium sp.]
MTPVVTPLDGSLFGAGQPCFGCSPDHPAGFHLKFVNEGEDLVTRMTPAQHHQGPLGLMHGGLISTLADEAAAWAVLAVTGKFGFTTHFEARLSKGVRVGKEVEARARVTRSGSRVVKATVEIRQDAELCFTGDFTFVLLDRSGAEKLMGGPLPDQWAKYCR